MVWNAATTRPSVRAILKNALICLRTAVNIRALPEAAPAERCARSLSAKGFELLELYIRIKIQSGTLRAADLCNKDILTAAERYLETIYPDLDLRKNPANELLYERRAGETSQAIRDLILNSDLENISAEELEDPRVLEEFEQKLSLLYPELDLSGDPSIELLEGTWKEEVEAAIDQLASS